MTPLTATDIAEIIVFMLNRPAHVNIMDSLVMPVAQSAATMVHRDAESMKAPLIISLALLFMGCGIIAEPEPSIKILNWLIRAILCLLFWPTVPIHSFKNKLNLVRETPNSEGHALTRDYLVATLKNLCPESLWCIPSIFRWKVTKAKY